MGGKTYSGQKKTDIIKTIWGQKIGRIGVYKKVKDSNGTPLGSISVAPAKRDTNLAGKIDRLKLRFWDKNNTRRRRYKKERFILEPI